MLVCIYGISGHLQRVNNNHYLLDKMLFRSVPRSKDSLILGHRYQGYLRCKQYDKSSHGLGYEVDMIWCDGDDDVHEGQKSIATGKQKLGNLKQLRFYLHIIVILRLYDEENDGDGIAKHQQ